MELTRAGLHVLMLEAGAHIDPAKEFRHKYPVRDGVSRAGQARAAAPLCGERAQLPHHARQRGEPVHDRAGTVYRWGRSRCLGGRTLHWARATDRMADYEFKAASLDGYGMNWPIATPT